MPIHQSQDPSTVPDNEEHKLRSPDLKVTSKKCSKEVSSGRERSEALMFSGRGAVKGGLRPESSFPGRHIHTHI